MAKKLRRPWDRTYDLGLHLFSAERLLRLAFFWHFSTLVKQMFNRITLTQSPFFMAAIKPSLSRVVSIQTTPAPLLGLLHVASLPGLNLDIFVTYWGKLFCYKKLCYIWSM